MPKKKIPPAGQVPRKDEPLADPREELFCWEYLTHYNATRAFKVAFPPDERVPDKNDRFRAHKLITRDHIVRRIGQLQAQRLKIAKADAVRVIQELAKIAFAKPEDAVKVVNGRVIVRDTDEMAPDTRACIQEITETTTEHGGSLRIKLYDKVKALQTLKEMTGALPDEDGSGQGNLGASREAERGGLREALRRKTGR